MIKTIDEIEFDKELLNDYDFQQYLTKQLDLIDWDFTQDIINQIVLWKVNRYAKIDINTFELLNKINKQEIKFSDDLIRKILENLISIKWIKLPIASTILRFKNPNVFQIIDQRVYRIIYWKELDLSWLKNNEIIDLYLLYLKDLSEKCNKYSIDFALSDRILYLLDKKVNKKVKIKY